jgi:cytochrome b561
VNNTDSKLYDSPKSFGWISIALHWLTAIIVFLLWFLGDSIAAQDGEMIDQRRSLHVSVAVSAYLLLVYRIYWRFKIGHPHVSGQGMRIHQFAQAVHYLLLVAIAVMLLSGPIMVLASGGTLSAFGLFSIPLPSAESEALRSAAFAAHAFAGTAVISLTVLHIAGALKHLMFNEDETIVRMLKPKRRDRQT